MLIQCPNCGKPISDKAKECIHCKYQLNVATAQPVVEQPKGPAIDYSKLSVGEKNALIDEFSKEQPEKGSVLKKALLINKIGNIFMLVCVVGLILCLLIAAPFTMEVEGFMRYEVYFMICACLLLLVSILALIMFVVFAIIYSSMKNPIMNAGVLFVEWAKKRNVRNVIISSNMQFKI